MEPVLIVGAGIVGLTLGQALQKRGIPFEIYERDPHPDSRGQGWAITLHWALEYLHQILPQDTLRRISDVQVDPKLAAHDNGNFLFLNLATGEPRFKIPPSVRWRVNREKTRKALLVGIGEHVHWGRRVTGIHAGDKHGDTDTDTESQPNSGSESDSEPGSRSNTGAELLFADGTRVSGKLIVGVEGSRSMVRQILRPDAYSNVQLPVRFTGVAVDLTEDEIAPLRAMDPLLFQGCHPETGVFFWFSMLETPDTNTGTQDPSKDLENPGLDRGTSDRKYRAQINMSWPVHSPTDEVPTSDAARLANMKRRAHGFAPFLYDAVQRIPDGTPVLEIKLADWECLEWDNRGGRVTLAGDAAHAMTMYRGEAANHGLLDAFHLTHAIEEIYAGTDPKTALDGYENEMRARTSRAVRLSRQACLDAHAWERLNEDCAILSKRAIT